jgi:hypothetical protein
LYAHGVDQRAQGGGHGPVTESPVEGPFRMMMLLLLLRGSVGDRGCAAATVMRTAL